MQSSRWGVFCPYILYVEQTMQQMMQILMKHLDVHLQEHSWMCQQALWQEQEHCPTIDSKCLPKLHTKTDVAIFFLLFQKVMKQHWVPHLYLEYLNGKVTDNNALSLLASLLLDATFEDCITPKLDQRKVSVEARRVQFHQ